MSTIAANPVPSSAANHLPGSQIDLPPDLEQIARVKIVRKRGRIAGFGRPRVPVEVLWCGSNRPRKKFGERKNGWSFPPRVRELLLQETQGKTVIHFFGGLSDFGVRMDMDTATNPHILGDAFNPPLPRDSFDVVVLDPPYYRMGQQEKIALLRAARWVARERVYWFHTVWIATDRHLPLERAYLVRIGDQCAARVLQIFSSVPGDKLPPCSSVGGRTITYERWKAAGVKSGTIVKSPLLVDRGKSPAGSCQIFLGDWK